MTELAIQRSGAIRQRAKNFASSFTFVSAAYLAYRFLPHVEGLRHTWSERAGISGLDVLNTVYVAYSALLLAFYAIERTPREAKAVGAVRALISYTLAPRRTWEQGLAPAERLGLLTMLLKGFFAPLMVMSLFAFTTQLIENGAYLATHFNRIGEDFLAIFNSHGFWFLLQVILFVDVFFFTVGYMIEHPLLRNEIRSVDSTWLGWGVTLICYPPINQVTVSILGGNVAEFPQFDDPAVHVAVNLAILALMGVYASASVALNLKGSNLTHRGIIDYGPYRYVRHPAYVCKNAAWWLGTLPAVLVAWQQSAWQALLVVGSAVAWTCIYALRALTEEDHLKRVDGAYEDYCRKVPYRFIPGVY
jgi:protein-S-isoprenylcysteine O-methyltransferase Ste14